MNPFMISPIFAVAKKKDGEPKRDALGRQKYRQAHHLSRGDKDHLSVNEMSADVSAGIKYETVQDAVDQVFAVARVIVENATAQGAERQPEPSSLRQAATQINKKKK